MKKSLITLTTAAIMAVSMSITSWAMTAEEVTAKNSTSYTAGTNSIYGPSLSQEQLGAVAQATADFMTNNITDGMDTDQKIKAAYDYIKNRTTYVDWNAATGANTAYTLVTGQGACSGMCRSMKALCDAMGIECYHVHSTSNDHQWNLVRYGDGILYHVDIDANKSAGQDIIYKSLTHPLPFDTSAYPAVGQAQAQTQPTTPQPTDGIHTMRASQDGAVIKFWYEESGLPIYANETREGVNCTIINENVSQFKIRSTSTNINPDGHYILVYGARKNTMDNKQFTDAFPLEVLGEPMRYNLEYDKDYSLDFTRNNMSATELSDFCTENNIIIVISVIDDYAESSDTGNTGLQTCIAYATSSSVQTGIGSTAN